VRNTKWGPTSKCLLNDTTEVAIRRNHSRILLSLLMSMNTRPKPAITIAPSGLPPHTIIPTPKPLTPTSP
jgi:hypothetical protein